MYKKRSGEKEGGAPHKRLPTETKGLIKRVSSNAEVNLDLSRCKECFFKAKLLIKSRY